MQKISLQKFKEIYEKFKPNVFIFITEKQNTYQCADFNIEFSDIKIIVNQNLMHLYSGRNYITLNNIRYIGLECSDEEDSFVFTVSCNTFSDSYDADIYTFIMRKSIFYN